MPKTKKIPSAKALVAYAKEHNIKGNPDVYYQKTYDVEGNLVCFACAIGLVGLLEGLGGKEIDRYTLYDLGYDIDELGDLEAGFTHGTKDTPMERRGANVAKQLGVDSRW